MRSAKASKRRTVAVAYVPVLHEGYRSFFARQAKTADRLYVLGTPFVKEVDRLRKEIRALDPRRVAAAVSAWKLFPEVGVLGRTELKTLRAENPRFVLPDEDVSREFAERHLTDADVTFSPVFLRWDRDNSQRERKVREDAKTSRAAFDRKMIRAARTAAERTSDWWRRVGAVAVRDGKVLLTANNRHVPSAHSPWAEGDPRNNFGQGDRLELSTVHHAEASVVGEAARRGIPLEGADLYVTDFPCPPCAKLVAYSGIKRLFFERGYAVLDGQRILAQNGVEIVRVDGAGPDPKDPEAFRPYPKKPKR